MPKLSKLQIGMVTGAVLFFLVLPISLCVFLFTQLNGTSKTTTGGSYDDIPQVSWGRLMSRAFNQEHGNRLLQAQSAWTRGRAHVVKREFHKARNEFQNAITIYEDELGPSDLMVSTVLSMAADNEMKANQPKAAIKLYQRIIDSNKNQNFNRFLKTTMCELAEAKKESGDFAGALKVLRECLALQEKALGKDSEELIETINYIGRCLEDDNKPDGAEASFKRALEIAQKRKSDLWIRDCRSTLGEFYQGESSYEKSNKEFEEVLKYANKRDDWIRYAWSELSSNYLHMRDSKQLKYAATQALEIDTKNKKDSKAIVFDLFCLATACLEEKDSAEFEHYYGRLKQQLTLKKDHNFEVEQELRSEIRTWARYEYWDQALGLCKELLELDKTEKLHSYFPSATANDKRAFAQLLAASGRYEESEKYLRQQANISKQELKAIEKQETDASKSDDTSAAQNKDGSSSNTSTSPGTNQIDDGPEEKSPRRAQIEYRHFMTDLIALAIVRRDLKKALSLYKETKDAGEDISVQVSSPYGTFIEEKLELPKNPKANDAKIKLKLGASEELAGAEIGWNKSSAKIAAFLHGS